MFSQCSVSKVLWRSPLCRRPLLPPTRPLLTRFVHPLLHPLLLHKPRSWINSSCSHLQPSSAFQRGAGTERCFLSSPSWADGRAAACMPAPALLPARSASTHTGAGGANCKCGLSGRARLRNLVILKLWVCLLTGFLRGMGLEMFTVAFITSLLTHFFSVDCLYERGSSSSPVQHHLCLTPKEPAVRTGGPPNRCDLYLWLSRLLAPGCLWSSLEFTTKTWPTWGQAGLFPYGFPKPAGPARDM